MQACGCSQDDVGGVGATSRGPQHQGGEGWRCKAAAVRSHHDGCRRSLLRDESEPSVFEELNNLRVTHFETAGGELSKLGKMYVLLEVSPGVSDEDLRHAFRQQSAEYDGDVVWDIQRRIVVAEQF